MPTATADNEAVNNSKMTLKHLWSRIMSSKKYKINLKSTTKTKASNNKHDKPEDDWVTDSVPDFACENKIDQPNEQPGENMQDETTQKNERSFSQTDNEVLDDEDILKEKEEIKKNSRKRKEATKSNKKPNPPDPQQPLMGGGMNVYGGIVHIGTNWTTNNTFNVTNNTINQKYNGDGPKKERKTNTTAKQPPKVEAILNCDVKLEYSHIQFLSKRFGKSWREIGQALRLSAGLLDIIENRCENDIGEMSLQVLSTWMSHKGDKGTVGKLCEKLWNSNIANAKQAVKEFADDFSKFD